MLHYPLRIANVIDQSNKLLGHSLSWLALLLVVVQFALVVMSSTFRTNMLALQELLLYINGLMFLGGAGFTLLTEGHVRVDIFYGRMTERQKHWVNLLGTLFLLLPVIALLFIRGTPYVLSSWSIMEGSTETSGLAAIYILKSFILVFAVALGLQAISLVIKSLAGLVNKTGAPH